MRSPAAFRADSASPSLVCRGRGWLVAICAAIALAHFLAGATRPLYALPVYALLGGVALVWTVRAAELPALNRCTGVALIFVGYLWIDSWFAPVPYLSREPRNLALACLVVYLVFGGAIVSERHRIIFTLLLLIVGAASTCIGLIQVFADTDFMPLPMLGPRRVGARPSGFYFNPNHLATFFLMIAPLGVSVGCWGAVSAQLRTAMFVLGGICGAGLVLTISRAGYLCGVLSLVLFLSSARARSRASRVPWRRLVLVSAAIASLAAAVIYSLPAGRERLGHFRDYGARTPLWSAALQQVSLSPIVGTGLGSYLFYSRRFVPSEVQDDPVHAHCDFLELLAETGIVGGFLGVTFLLVHFKNRRPSGPLALSVDLPSVDSALRFGAFVGLAAALTHAAVDFSLRNPCNALVAATLFAMLSPPPSPDSRPARRPQVLALRLLVAGVGISLLAPIFTHGLGELHLEFARRHLRDRRPPQAIVSAAKAARADPANPYAFYTLGSAHLQQAMDPAASRTAEFERAADAFTSSLRIFPWDANTLVVQGWTLDSLGQRKAAEQTYAQLARWAPNWWQTHAYLGFHRELSGDLPAARAAYRLSLHLQGNDFARAGLERIGAE